ncbi:MAG TPA: SBBP repeat-containing protein, partial [Methylomirabilota bacterium]|nr:SBBP repeat-containing protein [Methylomirabilota bacterium]
MTPQRETAIRSVGLGLLAALHALLLPSLVGAWPGLSPAMSSPPSAPDSSASRVGIVEGYGRLPLAFEANRGQTDPRVDFLARGRGYTLFLTPTEAVLVLKATPGRSRPASPAEGDAVLGPAAGVVRMKLVGANSSPRVVGLDALPGRVHYFLGNDPTRWRTDIPTYARVRYDEVYPGVSLVYYGRQGQLEYDLVVAPGADPAPIRLAFEGAEGLALEAGGDLVVRTAHGELRLHAPVVYQEVQGTRVPVPARFTLVSEPCPAAECHVAPLTVGVAVAAYDSRHPLVIDPVLIYSTFLGGSGADEGFGIAVDAAGSAYVTGWTASASFPTTAGALDTTFNGGSADAFVTKLNSTGSALVYSTYLGGSGEDKSQAIAVDAAGNAYVTGWTDSSDFPTTAGAFQTALGGGRDAFVAKLNPSGSGLVYSTYLGGSGNESNVDFSPGIALDAAGNAYVTGGTSSSNFPTTAGAFQTSLGGSFDAFVTKLNPTGTALVYSTYLGGSGDDQGHGIQVDASGHAYVTGYTGS